MFTEKKKTIKQINLLENNSKNKIRKNRRRADPNITCQDGLDGINANAIKRGIMVKIILKIQNKNYINYLYI